MDSHALPILIGLRNTILRISKIEAFSHSQGHVLSKPLGPFLLRYVRSAQITDITGPRGIG